ncbi:MAG: hypothetical protein E7350_02395, partial [Clostridiales bacterium]|nr:hypothetical protein [Clostridiales bacterium]
MTTQNQTTQTEKEGVKYENIKRLKVLMAQESELSALISDVKNVKRKIDEMLTSFRAAEKKLKTAQKEEPPVAEQPTAVAEPQKQKQEAKEAVRPAPTKEAPSVKQPEAKKAPTPAPAAEKQPAP